MAINEVKALVDEWLRLDQNSTTRKEIETLFFQHNELELRKRLGSRIAFGTAGLRGRMEAGFSRMNDLTIIQASQGLCAYVLNIISNAKERGVVIGHDHRHNSDKWALLTARAFVSQGVKVYLHKQLVHTPTVPFSVRHSGAAAGVMITASHNPKWDNGYKVYWENAVQIIEPHDRNIAASITENLEPGAEAWDVDGLAESPLCISNTDEVLEAYFKILSSLCTQRSLNQSTDLKFVTTAMHGVGHPFCYRALETFGFNLGAFHPVEAQKEPDPEFPTVAFPNPEEKGALNMALAEADKQGAEYAFACDPDADRFAGCEKQADGTWIQFTGDQLGTLFADHVLESYKASGKGLSKLAMVASTVSSKMVETMAKADGFRFEECLTGFKWIGNVGRRLEAEGYEVPFGYEEAIGFMLGNEIKDKDGVSAMAVFAEMAVVSRKAGKRLSDRLEELYARHGFHQTRNHYFICRDPVTIQTIFRRLRTWSGSDSHRSDKTTSVYPAKIAGLELVNVRDLTTEYGYDSSTPDGKPLLPVGGGEMITFKLADSKVQVNMTLRTSGTEPKIKYYIEGRGSERSEVSQTLDAIVEELGDRWMSAKEFGLQ